MIKGNVDWISLHAIAGWAVFVPDSKKKCTISVRLNGKEIKTAKADMARADLSSLGMGTHEFAFSIKLSKKLQIDDLKKIEIFALMDMNKKPRAEFRLPISATAFRAKQSVKQLINVAVIGHSNIDALYYADKGTFFKENFNYQFFQLRDDGNEIIQPGTRTLSEKVIDELKLFFNQCEKKYIIALLGGNEHTVIGAVNHPKKFDFFYENHGNVDVSEGVEIIPFTMMKEFMSLEPIRKYYTIKQIRELFNIPVIVLQQPPIFRNEYVQKYPGEFQEMLELYGSAPESLRKKLWHLQTEIMQSLCKADELDYLTIPDETMDEEGFIVKAAYGNNCTHGNAWYGAKFLKKFENLILTKYEKSSLS